MFQFDTTINIGNILTLLGFVGGGFYFINQMKVELALLTKDIVLQNTKIDNQAAEISKLGQILTDQAVQNERMNNLDNKIEDLRNGRGFVVRQPHELF